MRQVFKAALFAASALATTPAHAQDTEAEVVVTATRTPTEADRLPARVDVIDRDEIEERGLATLPQALGPDAIQSGGVGAITSQFTRGANSNHTLALFDGIRLNDASTPTGAYNFGLDTLASIERVEIVRGPLSTLYGTDAIGGVVNIIPRRGGDGAFEPFAEIEAGSFETRRGLLGAAGTTGGLAYGLSAESYDTEGFDQIPERITTNTGHPDGAQIDTFTASGRWENERFGFDLLARQRDGEIEYDTGFPRADDVNLEQETSQTLWRLGVDMNIVSSLQARVSGGEVDGESEDSDNGAVTNRNAFTRSFADASLRWSVAQAGFLDAPSITGGFSWERETARVTGGFNDPLNARQSHEGAYVVGQAGFGGGFSGTASARIDDYEGFGTHATYALGLVSDLREIGAPVRLFASYGTAFHAPSLNERFASGLFQVPNPELEPEESESWEIGADIEFVADVLWASLSYYETDVENLVTYDFLSMQNRNINRASIEGIEAELRLRPAAWFEAALRYDLAETADLSTTPIEPLPRRPENVWSFEAALHPTDRLSFSLEWNWVDERWDFDFDDAGNPAFSRMFIDSYSVGNLAATFDITDNVQVFGRVDNVTDEEYEPTAGYRASPQAAFIGLRYR